MAVTIEEKTVSPTTDSKDSPSVSDVEENYLINENALLRKLDARLLPAVGILYLLSFLDRSNGMISRQSLLSFSPPLTLLNSW
jgi:hypothetical protein